MPDIDSVSMPIGPGLIDSYLRVQSDLTAVERFAQFHDDPASPHVARSYKSLIPATPPASGEQYAFEVDLDLCSGCKACVTACHNLNGLDEGEAFRNVGLLLGGTTVLPVLQHVTTACHHCLDPACLSCCPVRAYTKNPETGIVKHLDDQCIGCQYCVFACPYDVPKYHKGLGIVRKCDMCSERLASSEAPACVQACPQAAIKITVVRRVDIVANCETNQFLPGAPEPSLTLPTTTYKTRRQLPRNLLPADYYSVRPEHAHLSLVVMLVLTQLSVGAFLIQWLLRISGADAVIPASRGAQAASALAFGLLALGASTLHLGRPWYAFRALLGLTSSWLSREILAFGLFALFAALAAGATLLNAAGYSVSDDAVDRLTAAVSAIGLAAVACSVMVYQCTRREFWNGLDTGMRFFLTTLLLGLATTVVVSLAAVGFAPGVGQRILSAYGRLLCEALMAVTLAKLLFEASALRHLWDPRNTSLKRSAILLSGELAPVFNARWILGVVGGIALPWVLLQVGSVLGSAAPTAFAEIAARATAGARALLALAGAAMLGVLIVGELLERYLFFAAVVPPRMPGGPTP